MAQAESIAAQHHVMIMMKMSYHFYHAITYRAPDARIHPHCSPAGCHSQVASDMIQLLPCETCVQGKRQLLPSDSMFPVTPARGDLTRA